MAVGKVNVGNSKSNTYIWQFEGYENIKKTIVTTDSQVFVNTIPIGDYVIGDYGRVWKENGQSLIQIATLADYDSVRLNRRHFKDNKVMGQTSSSSNNYITLSISNLLTGAVVTLPNPPLTMGFTKNVLYFIHEENLIVLDKVGGNSYKKLVYRWSDGTLISNEDINSFYYTTYGGGLTYSSLDGYFYVVKDFTFYKINANTMEVIGQVQTPYYCHDYIFKDGFAYLFIQGTTKSKCSITIINTNTMKLVKIIPLTNLTPYGSIDSDEDYVIVTTGTVNDIGKVYFINSSNTIEQSIDFRHDGVAGKYNFFSKDGVFIYKLKEKNL